MKSILIIDMPEDFDYRRCSIGGDGNIYYERDGEQRVSIIGNIKNLKPMSRTIPVDWIKKQIEEGKYRTCFVDYIEWDRCLRWLLNEIGEEE